MCDSYEELGSQYYILIKLFGNGTESGEKLLLYVIKFCSSVKKLLESGKLKADWRKNLDTKIMVNDSLFFIGLIYQAYNPPDQRWSLAFSFLALHEYELR